MKTAQDMLSFDEARARVLSFANEVGPERVALDDADGRVLRETVLATCDLPPFDHSAMDGYAIRVGDLVGAGPFDLPVRGESAAGGPIAGYEPGSALRIFTGAPLPSPADAVIMQENVTRAGERIRFDACPTLGQHIRKRGEDLALGSVALATGTRLTPGALALLASLDRPTLSVGRKPVVTILASGDELRSPGDPPRPGSIAESNGYFVAAAARRAGAIARVAPFVRDDADIASKAVADALSSSDLLVTIGGVSVGDHDVMRPALEKAGVAIDFFKVAMKPGKPLTVGRRNGLLVLGLPGNPASASMTFLLFGIPLLRKMQGDLSFAPLGVRMPVKGSLSRKPGRREFLRATLSSEGGRQVAVIRPNQASGAVTSFAEATAIVIVPEETTQIASGDELEVLSISAL